MKVLLTVHRYRPSIGGTEVYVEGLATHLARSGHDVTVATSSEPGAPPSEERDGVTIRRFDLLRKGRFRFPGRDYHDFVRDGGRWDVLNIHGQRVWSSDYIYGIARTTRTPVVFTAHGFYQYHMNRLRPIEGLYYQAVLPFFLKRAHVVALTEAEKEEFVRFGFDARRIEVIPNSLDPTQFQTPHAGFRRKHGFGEDEPLLLYVGGFYPNKRVEDLVRISARVGCKLVVVGRDPDPQGRNLEACRRLALQQRADVAFLGPIPWEDVLSAYQECTLLLLASKFEGYGLVLLEAMASGLPFVASKSGAAPELARLGGGISVEGWDRMAAEVGRLLNDKPAREAIARRGPGLSRAFSWERGARSYQEIYARAIREQGGARA